MLNEKIFDSYTYTHLSRYNGRHLHERVIDMLNRDVQAIKGVGQKIADDLYHMGIYTVEDLLFYFPYRYNVYEIKPLAELIHGDTVTIEGRIVHHPSLTFYGKKRSRLVFTVDVERVA